ncbi:DNA-binding transcriptional LysR family regulator [Inhella inkyongensis]|uniref:DNA-binding transcriptional LysR family regulator n=1 Tax=Inhella inkyongensis TaxID=392593 RepID=A0A840S9P0_9BURK|nr:LysR family transcriptional regulator [Inhella inkyongensis]MBB5206342.1 DNA-binding transcriptional LysR family regulator [Inhella inkyongensis]
MLAFLKDTMPITVSTQGDSHRIDDWLLVTEIAHYGSLVQAAKARSLSHATAFRRLQALEQHLGVRLFDRRAGHYTATAAGEALAEAGRGMQAQAHAALLRVQGEDLRPRGLVRLASTEGVIGALLLPRLPALQRALPDIQLMASARNDFHNLSQREADLALRPATEPPAHLIGQRIGPLRHAIYAARSKLARFRRAPLAEVPWLALDDSAAGSKALRWLASQVPLEQVTLRFSGLLAVRSACTLGLGLAVLPCFLGDTEPALARLGEPLADCDSELWLLSHPELRETVRVKAVREWLLKTLGTERDLLAGLRPLQA